MIAIAYTINLTPDAEGKYTIKYNAVSDDPAISSRNGRITYRPRKAPSDNNDLRQKASAYMGSMIGLAMRGDTQNSITTRCMNPASDFMSKKELIAARGYKFYGPKKKADVLAQAQETPVAKPAVANGERAYVVVSHKNPMTGAVVWTIERSDRKMYTEQEAKEALFKMQLESLGGPNA